MPPDPPAEAPTPTINRPSTVDASEGDAGSEDSEGGGCDTAGPTEQVRGFTLSVKTSQVPRDWQPQRHGPRRQSTSNPWSFLPSGAWFECDNIFAHLRSCLVMIAAEIFPPVVDS
ncbi:hypothetical protein DO97_12470 [Neosynechococcus sphagnicola sy1]|uniref:Uncharacterized protein n=1 Tax=Neosynechococcus sphagnicola sy1 TaxID=1497020 RepID=A0A098TML8_9CYAN|nr:hypothetical protein [Neosynechococcus sphagnicola]KGF72073.1 hypothetical protein DO97_12470 [Neosynechococcus sphagnicola sy1]